MQEWWIGKGAILRVGVRNLHKRTCEGDMRGHFHGTDPIERLPSDLSPGSGCSDFPVCQYNQSALLLDFVIDC